jgi:hypothetical protein
MHPIIRNIVLMTVCPFNGKICSYMTLNPSFGSILVDGTLRNIVPSEDNF